MDVYHNMYEDLQVSPSGDLLLVSGEDMSKQRVLRRLLTPLKGYIMHPDYGAGIPQDVGAVLTPKKFAEIKSAIIANIKKEATVAKYPAPEIELLNETDGLFCQIKYVREPDKNPVVLAFSLNNVIQ